MLHGVHSLPWLIAFFKLAQLYDNTGITGAGPNFFTVNHGFPQVTHCTAVLIGKRLHISKHSIAFLFNNIVQTVKCVTLFLFLYHPRFFCVYVESTHKSNFYTF